MTLKQSFVHDNVNLYKELETMPINKSSVINIALVGGRTYCKEVLEKTNLGFIDSEVSSRIISKPGHSGNGACRKTGT